MTKTMMSTAMERYWQELREIQSLHNCDVATARKIRNGEVTVEKPGKVLKDQVLKDQAPKVKDNQPPATTPITGLKTVIPNDMHLTAQSVAALYQMEKHGACVVKTDNADGTATQLERLSPHNNFRFAESGPFQYLLVQGNIPVVD